MRRDTEHKDDILHMTDGVSGALPKVQQPLEEMEGLKCLLRISLHLIFRLWLLEIRMTAPSIFSPIFSISNNGLIGPWQDVCPEMKSFMIQNSIAHIN